MASVKGGKQLNPSMVRDQGGTVQTQKAEMGVLMTLSAPTRGMEDEVNHAGSFQHPASGATFPRISDRTIDKLLSGKRPKMPPAFLPYIQAAKHAEETERHALFEI